MLYHKTSRIALSASLSALALGLSAPAFAQSPPEEDEDITVTGDAAVPDDEIQNDDLHDRRVNYQGEIIVTASGLKQFDLLAGTDVFEGPELQQNLAGQIGEVLVSIPGVSASGFAPGASRPVLRGFSGERVKVLVDGIGAIDVSNTSADHAVSIDPLTAERIEVLRGPAVLLYGSQAIGGAVNVIDKRIPRRMTSEPVHMDAIVRADTATDLREAGASFDVPIGSSVVAHLDGSWRESGDLEIPDFAVAPGPRAELLDETEEEASEGHLDEAEELREAALQRDFVPNTATETWTANAGLAFFKGESTFGVSVGVYDTNYGIPGRPGAGHAHGEEGEEGEEEGEVPVTIDLRQYRADFRGDIVLGDGFFERLLLRAGYSDYTHTEFEGDEVGTVFDVAGIEARAELVQNTAGRWRGSWGLQYMARDFDAVGAEAYVAPNRTEQLALFALQEYGDGPIQLEGALRYETTDVDSVPLGLSRSFDTLSGAIGLAYDGPRAFRAGVNLSRVARAPSAEELFSNGPHIASQAFEIGDPDLVTERAWGVELFARGRAGDLEFNLAAFKNWFDDYIYQLETGAEEDGLPVFQYLQQDATYAGVEGEVSYTFLDTANFDLTADLRAEYVRAKLSDGTDVPRIPPLGVMGALEASTGRFDVRGEVEWFADQTRTAPFETATDGFTMVNASITWHPLRGNDGVTLVLKADNIFDVTGRRHASFTKDFVPLAGRNISASLRASF